MTETTTTKTNSEAEHFFVSSIIKIGGTHYLKIPQEIYNLDKTYNRPIQLFCKYVWLKDNVLNIMVSDQPLIFKGENLNNTK